MNSAPHSQRERGAAVADFAMIAGLVALIFVAVLQLGLTLHIRNTLISCASEGARYGARLDASPALGGARARELISESLSSRYAQKIAASVQSVDGVQVVVVTATVPTPIIGPFGLGQTMTVTGRAFQEAQ